MTVYAELLKLALAERATKERSLDELVADALSSRDALGRGDGPTRLAAALAYDAALVQLCRRLGVDQQLTGDSPGPDARRRAEEGLAAQLPNPSFALG